MTEEIIKQVKETIAQIEQEKTAKGISPNVALVIEISSKTNISFADVLRAGRELRDAGIIRMGPTINQHYFQTITTEDLPYESA